MEHLDRQLKVTASSMLSQLNSGCNRSRFNVMTVGPCCIGKTMFLESLLKDYVSDDVNSHKSPRTNISESPGLEWQGDETDKLQVMEVGQARLSSVDLVIYDSNGYGDIVNNQEAIDVIRSHLMLAHANWRKLDVQCMSAEEILKCDERIHCIFYFFSAHGIKENDIDFLSHFSGIVPIIPVVAKADTMTLSERNAFLYQMNQAIRRLSEAAGSSVVYDFSSENNFEVVSSPSKSVEIENGHMNQLEAPQSQRSSIYGAGSMETMGDSNLNRSETESDPISTIKRKTSGLPVPMTLSAKADRGIALAASGFMIHNTQCRPSPEFIALFPHVDDFDASTTSTLFDESRPLERRDSLCSLDSNEELNDSSHSHTLSNRDRSNKFSPTISPNNDQSQGSYYAETSHVTDRAEFANMQRSGSDMERGDSDLDNLFDQETFVNVGKALSNNTHEHFDFGRISGDSDYEGTSVNNMMESAVFVSVITESYSHEDYETERSLPPEHHNTPVSTCTYDDSNTLVSTAEMMEVKLPGALICKLVTHEVCDLIVNPGEKAACRIVSKIVCEHFVPQNSKIDDEVDDSGNMNLAAQSNGEFPGDNRGGSECTSMDPDRMDQVAQVAKDNVSICTKRVPHPCIGSYFQRNIENHEGVYEVNALMAGEDPNVGLVLHCDTEANDNTGLRMKRIDGDLGSRIPDSDTITMDSNGVYSNPNIFAIICKESQSDGGVAFGFSDVTRLQYLLFEGPHINLLINKTREKSIKLFPSKNSAILWNFTRCVMIFLKKILDSMEFLSCCSSKTKLSPKTFSKLFSPHDSVRSHSLFTNSCGIFGIIYSTFWSMGSNIFCPQKDQQSQISKSIKLTWLNVYLMLLRSVFEKLREKGLYISRFLTFIFYTGYTKTMKSIEKLKICSNHIKNLSERNNSTHRMQMRSDIVDITTQVICSDTVTSSHTDANEIRTFVRIDTSAAPVRDWYENRNILSLLGLVITVSVFSALRCIIFSGDVQRVMPLSKSTTTYSLRSSAMSPTTEGADNMKNLAWIYSSEEHDLSAGCSAACSMCGTLLNTPTETREINKPVNKLLNRQLISSIASTKTADNKSYYNAPYPAPTEERFFPSPVEQIESIDTSRGLSSHCQQHDQDGTYEYPSGLHSVLDTSSIEVSNSGVSSNMIGEYLESEYHAVMDIDTGVVSTSTFSAWGKSTGNKVENHQIKIATNIVDQGDMILFSVPVIFDYDQRVEKSAFIGFPKNYRNVDYSKSTERPMKRFTIEDAENFTPLKEGPTESPIQYYIDYVANEVVNYKTEKFRTLRDDMKNPTEQIIIALKKAIQYIMSAIQIDLNELKSIVESFTSIVIDGYRTLMKYMEMEFHRW